VPDVIGHLRRQSGNEASPKSSNDFTAAVTAVTADRLTSISFFISFSLEEVKVSAAHAAPAARYCSLRLLQTQIICGAAPLIYCASFNLQQH